MFRLLGARRFGPLFATQFLGAFNDNLYKTAMLFLITYGLMANDLERGALLVTIASGVFILPFFLFSAMAGQLSDAIDKSRVVRAVKTAEVGIMLIGATGLLLGSVPVLMLALFAMGLHSTFFGPVKYAILPQHLSEDELLGGTSLVEAGTFVAILTGQILAGLISPQVAAAGVLIVAALGWWTGRRVPPAPAVAPVPIERNIVASTFHVLRAETRDRRLLLAMLGVSWFWAMGAVLTTLFVPLVKGELHASEHVATAALAIFSIGIAIGSLWANRLLHGRISARFAPWAALAMALCLGDLTLAVLAHPVRPGAELLSLADFARDADSWRFALDLIGLSVAGGLFVVPLYAILQRGADPSERARVIAANNIVNSLFMVFAALGSGAMLSRGLKIADVILVLAALNLGAAVITARLGRFDLSPG